MSPTLKSTGDGSRWGKIWEKGFDRRKLNFKAIYERHEAVATKSCRYLLPFEHNART